MIQAGYKMKALFFNPAAVLDPTERARQRVLSRFGAFVRQRIIASMLGHRVRKGFGVHSKVTDREGASAPGEPPHPHTGLLVKMESFGYDRSAGSVIIGPERLNKPGSAPEALEYGGQSVILEGLKGHRKRRTVTIRKRPSAVPAFQIELEKMPPLWRDSIR